MSTRTWYACRRSPPPPMDVSVVPASLMLRMLGVREALDRELAKESADDSTTTSTCRGQHRAMRSAAEIWEAPATVGRQAKAASALADAQQ